MRDRKELVEKGNPKVSMRTQCKLLSVSRSSVGYRCKEQRKEDLEIKRLLDEIYRKRQRSHPLDKLPESARADG